MRNIIIQIVLMTFTHQHEGYIIKVNKSKLVKYGVDSLLQKYLNPMRRLTEELPNHNVEVQLEIVGSMQQSPSVEPQRRYVRLLKQPPRRYNADSGMSPPMPITTTDAMTVTTTHQPEPTTRQPEPTTRVTTTVTTTDIGQRPVYMDDLRKALDEFEKKFTTTESTTTPTTKNCEHRQFTFTRIPFRFTRPSTPLEYPIDRSIQGIIKLLRSGVHLESPVAKPTNENLEWLQLKIPKTP